jgi:uncharacterized membrane protein
MGEAVNPWLHIFAATVWVGPQVFLFVAAIPAVRTIEDAKERARVMRALTTRFGWLALAAFVLLVITGIGRIYEDERGFGLPLDELFDLRWGIIFQVKMTLVVITAVLTALHAFVIGPRLLRMQEESSDAAVVAQLRRLSIGVSAVNALVAFGILFCAALLSSTWAVSG